MHYWNDHLLNIVNVKSLFGTTIEMVAFSSALVMRQGSGAAQPPNSANCDKSVKIGTQIQFDALINIFIRAPWEIAIATVTTKTNMAATYVTTKVIRFDFYKDFSNSEFCSESKSAIRFFITCFILELFTNRFKVVM